MKILVVGDSYLGSDALRSGLAPLAEHHELEFMDMKPAGDFQPRSESERQLLEYEGDPDQLAAALTDHDVLVVHGAPVSMDVLQSSPRLRLVCCARGGPVNVDVEAAGNLGISVATTPGKNAPAVAELTIALAVMLTRAVGPATAHLRSGARLVSAFDGAQFLGSELSGMRLGLVGFGRVGLEVCSRALAFGMMVKAHDPLIGSRIIEQAGAEPMDLIDLVQGSDIVSLHARQTPDNLRMVGDELLTEFSPGAYLINTAREDLLDEDAVMQALTSGHLAGVAVDVFHDVGPIAEAVVTGDPRLIALPHIGGATYETIRRASDTIVDQIERFVAGNGLGRSGSNGTSTPTYRNGSEPLPGAPP